MKLHLLASFQDVCIEFKCERVCFEFQSTGRCQAEKSTETDNHPPLQGYS